MQDWRDNPPPDTPFSSAEVSSSAQSAARLRLRRVPRVLLRRFLRAVINIGRILCRYAAGILIALLLGVVAIETYWLVQVLTPPAEEPATRQTAVLPPAPAVQRFIRGQQTYDATLMWEALGEQLRTTGRERGLSLQSLQNQVEQERQSGQRYVEYEYIGGVNLSDGKSMFFYVVQVESPQPERNGTISYVFTVGTDGKIIHIE